MSTSPGVYVCVCRSPVSTWSPAKCSSSSTGETESRHNEAIGVSLWKEERREEENGRVLRFRRILLSANSCAFALLSPSAHSSHFASLPTSTGTSFSCLAICVSLQVNVFLPFLLFVFFCSDTYSLTAAKKKKEKKEGRRSRSNEKQRSAAKRERREGRVRQWLLPNSISRPVIRDQRPILWTAKASLPS